MNRVFPISATLSVLIKEKNDRIYIELNDGVSRFFISAKTWNDTHWMEQVDNSTDETPIGYLKYGSKQSGGLIQLQNRGLSKSRFLITSTDWMSLHDIYEDVKNELIQMMNNTIHVYHAADDDYYLREIDVWTANGNDISITKSSVPYPGDAKIVLSIVAYMIKNRQRHHPTRIAAAVATVFACLNRPNGNQHVDCLVNKIYVRGDVGDIDKAMIPLEYIHLFEKLSICDEK